MDTSAVSCIGLSPCCSWTPLKAGKGDDVALIEFHPFALKKKPLQDVVAATGAKADATLGIDDAVPRNAAVTGKGIEGVADETSVTGNSGKPRDLTIRCHASTRNP